MGKKIEPASKGGVQFYKYLSLVYIGSTASAQDRDMDQSYGCGGKIMKILRLRGHIEC